MLEVMTQRGNEVRERLTSTSRRRITSIISLYLLGAVLSYVGVVDMTDRLRWLIAPGVGLSLLALIEVSKWAYESDEQNENRTRLIGWSIYVVASVIVMLAAGLEQAWVGLSGVWSWALGLSMLTPVSTPMIKSRPRPWVIAALVSLGVTVWLGYVLREADWVLVLAMAVSFLALVALVVGLIGLAEVNTIRWLSIGTAIVATASFIVVALLLMGLPRLTLIPCVGVLVAGLVLVGNSAPYEVATTERWKIATGLFLSAGIGSIVAVTVALTSWPFQWKWALAGALLVALIALALPSQIIGVVLILLMGLAITAGLVNRVDNTPEDAEPEGSIRLIAFGDSYISGEGADRFFPGTNKVGTDECRRSSTSYPHIVAQRLRVDLDFYACSGAKTFEVVAKAAEPLAAEEETQLFKFKQVEAENNDPRPIAAVLVSVGGNDSWFGTLGQACFAPGTCDVHRNTLIQNINEIGGRIEVVYKEMRAVFGEETPVVAMPYPLVMTEDSCEASPLTSQEHRFLFEFTEVLNEHTRVGAVRAGVHWFEPGVTAFDEHRICETDEDVAINVLDISPKRGSLWSRILPTHWAHGSAHPNEDGHRYTADHLTPWLEDLLERIEDEGISPNPEPAATTVRFTPPSSLLVSTRSLNLDPPEECPTTNLDISVEVESAFLGVDKPMPRRHPGSTLCHSQPDKGWLVLEVEDAGEPVIPAWDRGVALDFDPEIQESRQIILSESVTGRHDIHVVSYCELDVECADTETDIRGWMLTQLANTGDLAALPLLFLFVGVWLLAVRMKALDLTTNQEQG